MRAALMLGEAGVLEVDEVQIDKPAPHEVLVRTVGSGLCHSDLHFIDMPAALAGIGGPPAVLGHEAAGVVEAVGENVGYVSPGDHVITFPVQFCGECEYCLRGRPTLCRRSPGARGPGAAPRIRHDGRPVAQFTNLGGFAEQMLVHEHAVVKIDPEYPLDRAAIIGCGVATGLGAVLNTAQVAPNSSVAIVGLGGVGLSALQGAVLSGARQIIAVDTEASKFELARSLGATDTVDASSNDVVAAVKELSKGGVDYSFEAIGVKVAMEQCAQMLRPAGVATLIGVAMGQTIELDPGIFLNEARLQGSLMGSNRFRTDLPHYIELDRLGRIDVGATIEGHIHLDDINDGYEAMRQRSIVGRRVIVFDD